MLKVTKAVKSVMIKHSGVKAGDSVGIVLGNSLAYLVSFFAVVGVRAIAAPLNAAYKIDDFLFYMEDTEMKVKRFLQLV